MNLGADPEFIFWRNGYARDAGDILSQEYGCFCDSCDGDCDECDYQQGSYMEEAIGTDGDTSKGELRPEPADTAEKLSDNLYALIAEAKEIAERYESEIRFSGVDEALGCHIHLGDKRLYHHYTYTEFESLVRRDWLPIAMKFNPPSRMRSSWATSCCKEQPHGLEVRCFPATILQSRKLFETIADSLQHYAREFLSGNPNPKIKNKRTIARYYRIINKEE
jgi:hypothetical protein